MGILDAAGAIQEAPAPVETTEPEGAEEQAAQAAEAQAEPSSERGTNQQPKQPGSRRASVADIERTVTELKDGFTRAQAEWQNRINELQQHNMRLMETFAQRQAAPVQAPQAQGPDPSEIKRQAKAALDAGKFDEYERLNEQALVLQAERIADARVKSAISEVEKRIPQPTDPFVTSLVAKHTNVAAAGLREGERGDMAVRSKLNEMRIMAGMAPNQPNTPQMVAKAFELADQWLETLNKPAARPTYGQDATAVAGLPTGRRQGGAAAGGGDEPQLTDAQKRAAAASGMTPAEYLKWSDPSWAAKKKWG